MNVGRTAFAEENPGNNTQTYFHTDALGSVLATSKINKTIAARYDYDAWGEEIHNTGTSDNPIGYTGHQMDRDIGLIYANARYLDPDTGRFLSFDPFEGYDDKPISLHRYLYAYQNPLAYTDPTGKVPVLDETGEYLTSTGDELIELAGDADSASEAIAYGVGAGAGAGAGANYFIGGVVEGVNFALNIAGAGGYLGEGVQQQATEELHEAFDVIQTVVEDPQGTASTVIDTAKTTAQAAAQGDTKAIAKTVATATAFAGGSGVKATANTVKATAQATVVTAKAAKAVATTTASTVKQAAKKVADSGVLNPKNYSIDTSATFGANRLPVKFNKGQSVANKLLPTEGSVASHRILQKAGTKGDNITPHHIPSANHMAGHGVKKGDGISINMEQPPSGGRHRRTFTYGTQADASMSARDALAAGVRDARKIYQQDGLYSPYIRRQLQDLIRQNKAAHSQVFNKR